MMETSTHSMLARYRRAQVLEQGPFTTNVVANSMLYPHWAASSQGFHYTRQLLGGGQESCWVDAPAQTHQVVDTPELPKPSEPGVSPDGRYQVLVRDHNLWLKDVQTGQEKALTTDAEPCYRYASAPSAYGRQEAAQLDLLWSPDSQRILTQVIDTREVQVGLPLVEHVPADGSLRPGVHNPDRRVAFPGDEAVETYRFLSIDVATGQVQWADSAPSQIIYPPYVAYFAACKGWWSPDSRRAYFIELERGDQTGRLKEFDTHTGETKTLIEERAEPRFSFMPQTHVLSMLYPLPETDELVWYSERSGWAHLYLYDIHTGQLKNPITQGHWQVRHVLHVDKDRRELWIQTAGRTAGRNPYYTDICRVNLDTAELTEVVASDHNYVVAEGRTKTAYFMGRDSRGVSPNGDYVVATRTRVDQVPVTLLFDREGQQCMTVEEADVSGLPNNWQWPEPVMLKAADGETDIYATVFRPTDFDPNRSYPVLDVSYYHLAPLSIDTGMAYLPAAAYAELGFVVVFVNSRETALREKAFSGSPKALGARYTLDDSVAAIQQLARRYPYMDLNRVGVSSFGSTSYPLSAMLEQPDFYKAGVAFMAGDYGEQMSGMGMMGALDQDTRTSLPEQAANLKGKLLMVYGMMDDVIPVSIAFRLIDALQKANKPFDMLLLPNLGHGESSYATKRSWDYLVEHLLGEEPPAEFKLRSGYDLLIAANDELQENR